MNPAPRLELAVQLADAVADAHAHGIIHGDLRPDTIIMTPKGSAKILDFGFARWTRGGMLRTQASHEPRRDCRPTRSRSSRICRRSRRSAAPIDSRTDVFSLGVVIYEVLTGRNAFAAATASDTVVNVIQGPVPRATEINAGLTGRRSSGSWGRRSPAIFHSGNRAPRCSPRSCAPSSLDGAEIDRADRRRHVALLPLDERPDKSPAAGLLLGALGAAAVAAVAVWWWLSR